MNKEIWYCVKSFNSNSFPTKQTYITESKPRYGSIIFILKLYINFIEDLKNNKLNVDYRKHEFVFVSNTVFICYE